MATTVLIQQTFELPSNVLVPVYHGYPEENVHDFIYRYELYAKAAGLNGEQLGKTIIKYMASVALTRYATPFLNGELQSDNWDEVKKFLIEKFHVHDPAAVEKLTKLRKDPNQRVGDFYAIFCDKARCCFPGKQPDCTDLKDMLKNIFVRALDAKPLKRALRFDGEKSLDELVNYLAHQEYVDMLFGKGEQIEGTENTVATVEYQSENNVSISAFQTLKSQVKFLRKEMFKLKNQIQGQRSGTGEIGGRDVAHTAIEAQAFENDLESVRKLLTSQQQSIDDVQNDIADIRKICQGNKKLVEGVSSNVCALHGPFTLDRP
jgi:hypothetical protein